MTSIWLEGVRRGLDQALDLLAGGIKECSGDAWATPMWPVSAPGDDHVFLGEDWKPIDAGQRSAFVQQWVARRSTPWSVAWHALEGLDYDLTGEMGFWMPPAPFAGHPHWRDLPSLAASWTQSELLGYVEYCRRRVSDTLAVMSDADAARPLPAAHRYSGQPHAWIIAGLAAHTTEHAAQIRQFITHFEPQGTGI
ncbi:hypothetical protein AYO38_07860 [bacterium SCGC AG-212-C10]|nr:hypothetical protein AYO38_07860 [bacterium SCGC AG-212-C10]